MFKTFWNWLVGKIKVIFEIVSDTVTQSALDIINDPEIQALALAAVKAAANRLLTGDDAWVNARDDIVAALKTKGKNLSGSAIDTILQLAYYCFKNEEKGD